MQHFFDEQWSPRIVKVDANDVPGFYPLVICYIAMERSTNFNG